MTTPLLAVEDLKAGYADLPVLHDIGFSIAPGEVMCITGRNGVGKTTLMRSLSGEIPLMQGRVTFAGEDISTLPSDKRQKRGISYGPQDGVTFAPLSVRENLTLHHEGRGLERYAELFVQFPRIKERLDQTAGNLSGGERKILSFCRVMGEGGSLILLDEPTEGVAPENIERMAEVLRRVAKAGTALVIVEQNLSLVEAVATHALVLDHGQVIFRTAANSDLRAGIAERLKV